MTTKEELSAARGSESRARETDADHVAAEGTPRKLTFAENVLLTLKNLVGFLIVGALIWGVDLWKSMK
jgi:hypothetical protein